MTAFRPCILVPTYDNLTTVRAVVEQARAHLAHVVVVDDGSHAPTREVVEGLARDGLAHTVRRPRNGGKGAAVKTGFDHAASLGYTHALQVDADGQHTLEDVPRFLEASRANPGALVLGAPRFDRSAPRARRIGRRITQFWTHLETGRRVIEDPMCGFRVYPLEVARRVGAWGDAMDFDPEIAVRMVWAGTPVVNLPTRVRYLRPEEGGVSHFRMLRDNLLIAWMHTRLMTRRILRGGSLARRMLPS